MVVWTLLEFETCRDIGISLSFVNMASHGTVFCGESMHVNDFIECVSFFAPHCEYLLY